MKDRFNNLKLEEFLFVVNYIKENFPKGSKVLEAGCGTGKVVTLLLNEGFDAWGVDIATYGRGVNTSRLNVPFLPREKYKQEDMQKLSFPDKTFDVIFSIDTIINVGLGVYGDKKEEYGDRKAVEEFMRVLKDNGVIILTLAYGEASIKKRAHPFRVYDKERLKILLRNLEIIEEYYFYSENEDDWYQTKEKEFLETFWPKEDQMWKGQAILILKKKGY